jgi:small nuclear ribonucleoprotein (snRNP)-like protein
MQELINDLRIEKKRLPVAVMLMSGTRLDGELFVLVSGHRIGEIEDAPEALNSAEPFFPLALRSGDTILVAKENVRTVAVTRQYVHEDESLGIPTRVEIALRDGERLSGSLIIEPLAGHTRVLDYVNRHKERFLTLFGRDSVMLINRVLVERVRPLD